MEISYLIADSAPVFLIVDSNKTSSANFQSWKSHRDFSSKGLSRFMRLAFRAMSGSHLNASVNLLLNVCERVDWRSSSSMGERQRRNMYMLKWTVINVGVKR